MLELLNDLNKLAHILQESIEDLLRSNVDPAQIHELDEARGMLKFWEKQLKSMAWNLGNEDGTMVRSVDAPHESVLKLISSLSY